MTPTDLEDLFAPLGAVTCKRMFSGQGVYVGTACFAIATRGGIWLKADAALADAFEAAGSTPFEMTAPDGQTKVARAFWSLPEAALDDPDELMRWCRPALAAAQRTAAEKAAKLQKMRAEHGGG